MKFIDRIAAATERVILSRVKSGSLFAEYYNRSDKKVNWKRQVQSQRAKEIKDWTMAIMAATDPENPRRGELMRFYQSLMLDNHLASVIDTRILRVQRSSFKFVNEKGEENTDLKQLFERPWFDDLVRLVVGKQFQGTTLVEMFDTDENLELVRVTEIPQTNFIAQKGIIIKEEFDTQGVSYVEGIFKDYYLQIGGDWELGMLNQLAVIILAKKLGLGSWMSYIDKFGVPPVFAITERMDTGRRDELFEMLQNFRMNHFAVLQGNEKIEVPNNYNVDAYKSFQALINDVCNSEISKRVLGGTAMVDVKSFVGAAQVQERVAQDRYEADKLLFKYVFNTQVRPRLQKISGVYADLATHTLVWDNQETLDINGYIDGVEKLSQYYDFDIEEIKKRTGLPVTGVKSQALTGQPAEPATPQKKKPDKSVNNTSMPMLYGIATLPDITGRTWDDATERLASDIYNGKVKAADIDKDLVLKNYAALSKAAQTGWGEEYYTNDTARKMRENLISFSGAKAYNLISQIEGTGKTGMSREAFMEQAKKLVALHNETYLDVEKQFASAKSSAARDYQQYQKDTDIYPNLKLRTMEDDHVRESHAVLDGLVKPVKDWTAIPPFEPRCRCRLEQTLEPVSGHIPSIELNKQYANNPALTGEAFTEQHNYFQSVNKKDRATLTNNINLMKQYAPYSNVQEMKNGSKVFMSDFSDAADLEPNTKAAKKIADSLGKDVYIRPHSASNNGVKNPEFGIGKPSAFGDLKTYENMVKGKPVSFENYIFNALHKAANQKCQYAVLDIGQYTGDHKMFLTKRLCGGLTPKINKSIETVIVINGNKVSAISRKNVYKKDFKDFFEGL